MGKRDLLLAYTHMRAMEADLLQGVADKATIKRLEKEVSVANTNVAAAIAMNESKDAEIHRLKERLDEMEEDAKNHEAALLNAEILAGERAYFYGEWIMAYVRLAYPEINFVDSEYVVPEVGYCLKYRKIPNVKDFIRDHIRKVISGSAEESKPLVDLESEDLGKASQGAGDKNKDLIVDCTVPQEGTITVERI